jgi:glutathione S-transferase
MFCARVRRAIAALRLDIELRDVMLSREHHRELATFGGSSTVPCLRIGKDGDPARAEWMYESADIVAYLVERFGDRATA